MKKTLIFIILLISCCFEAANYNTEKFITHKKNINGEIEIPKIGLKKKFYDNGNVDKNIIVIKPSEHPSIDNSLLILAAHSGSGKYAYFNYLYKLTINDLLYIACEQIKYKYKIIDIYNVEKDGNIPIYSINSKKTLVLITCNNKDKHLQTVYISIEV